jgi:hypothetical protein
MYDYNATAIVHNIFVDLLACVYRVAGDEHAPLVVASEEE